jgi:enediyne biosynthesis protein E4
MKRFVLCILFLMVLTREEVWTTISPPHTAPSTTIRLTDVSASTGIDFLHHGGSLEKTAVIEEVSGGVALFDYDGDGWLDIYFVTCPSLRPGSQPVRNQLYRNNHDGTFTDVTLQAGVGFQGWSMGVCIGDYNGDGYPDLYVTNLGGNVLYRNNGDGTFTDVTRQAGVECGRFSTGAAFADYDGDGFLDLFVANYVEFDLTKPPKKGEFCDYHGLRVACGPRGLKGAPDFLYRNNGDGTFTDVSEAAGVSDQKGYYGLGVAWSDIDNDGDLDLFVANDMTPNYLYLNDGKGRFKEVGFVAGVAVAADSQVQAGMGVDVADYDSDGLLDIFVTHFSKEYNTLYRNLGKGMFRDDSYEVGLALPSLPYLGWGTKFFDVDCDGDLDVFVANGHVYPQVESVKMEEHYSQRNQLFINLGTGKFQELKSGGTGLGVVKCSRGAAFGDLDNDGDVDIVINNMDDTPSIVRNDTQRTGHWLGIKLTGRDPNRLAIGARVTAFIGTLQLVQEVRSGGSYLSQNDFRLHFGLGNADRVERLLIRWPNGVEQSLEGVAADQYILIAQKPVREGANRRGSS